MEDFHRQCYWLGAVEGATSVEHRRKPDRCPEDAAWCSKQGVRWQSDSRGAGVEVVTATWLGAQQQEWTFPGFRAVATRVEGILPHGVLMISAYFVAGAPIAEQMPLLRALANRVCEEAMPWIIGADFNMSPRELEDS
eukprot:5829625-Amphidinium_carterae.1